MLEKYSDIFVSDDYKHYKFTSVGVNGRISKVVRYYDLDLDNYYNLGFGDQDPETGDLNDLAISNNGDSEKVLATVAMTLYIHNSISRGKDLHYRKYEIPYKAISYRHFPPPILD